MEKYRSIKGIKMGKWEFYVILQISNATSLAAGQLGTGTVSYCLEAVWIRHANFTVLRPSLATNPI